MGRQTGWAGLSDARTTGDGTRERLQAIVSRRPGTSIRELADALGIRRTAVVHHLRKLSSAGRVRCVRSGRRLLVFPPAATPFEGLVGLLRLRTVQELLAAIQADPGASVRGLGRALGITPRAVRYHLMRLRSLGAVELHWGMGGRRVVLLDPKAAGAGGPGPAEGAEARIEALARR